MPNTKKMMKYVTLLWRRSEDQMTLLAGLTTPSMIVCMESDKSPDPI